VKYISIYSSILMILACIDVPPGILEW